jgi:hypothetical protein
MVESIDQGKRRAVEYLMAVAVGHEREAKAAQMVTVCGNVVENGLQVVQLIRRSAVGLIHSRRRYHYLEGSNGSEAVGLN